MGYTAVPSETPHIILPGKLLRASSHLQLEQCGKDLRRPHLAFQPLDQLVQLHRLIMPQPVHHQLFMLRKLGLAGSFLVE